MFLFRKNKTSFAYKKVYICFILAKVIYARNKVEETSSYNNLNFKTLITLVVISTYVVQLNNN